MKGEDDHIPTVSIFPWWMGNSGKFHIADINGAMLEREMNFVRGNSMRIVYVCIF